jgi:hypothetical protein
MALAVFLSPLFILAPLFVSPLFGTYWAAFIAGMIRYEYQQHRFDLMATLPGGGFGAYNTIATLHMRRSRLYYYMDDALNITSLIGGIGAFLLLSGLIVGLATPQLANGVNMWPLFDFVFSVLLVIVGLYADQIQSVILSYEVGIAVPLHTRYALEARVWGGTAYLSLQLTLYGLAGWVGFWLMPRLTPQANVLGILAALLLLFGLRELAVYNLRRHVITTLGQPAPETAS